MVEHHSNSLSDFLRKYYKEENREEIQQEFKNGDYFQDNNNLNLGFYKSIPNYVSILINQMENKGNDIDKWYEDEFKNQIKDLNAIMVYDVRDKNSY